MAEKPDNASLLRDLQLFHGPFAPMQAVLYARLPTLRPRDGYHLEGEVYGPLCDSSRTLPARTRLIDAGEGQTVLARAVVPDPCPWSAELPAVYRVSLCLSRGNEPLEHLQQSFGFLATGVSEEKLYRAGKPWCLRALSGPDDPTSVAWDKWRKANLAMLVRNPSDELCQAATSQGITLVALENSTGSKLVEEIRRLARAVCVAVVILPGPAPGFEPHEIAPNLLFGQDLAIGEGERPAVWADVLLVDSTALSSRPIPLADGRSAVLVQHRQTAGIDLARQWESLQSLQRDASAVGSFAGFLVRAT